MKERGGVGKASVKAPSDKTHRLRHFEPEQQHHQKSDRNDELSLQYFSDRKKRGCGVNVSAAGHGGKKVIAGRREFGRQRAISTTERSKL